MIFFLNLIYWLQMYNMLWNEKLHSRKIRFRKLQRDGKCYFILLSLFIETDSKSLFKKIFTKIIIQLSHLIVFRYLMQQTKKERSKNALSSIIYRVLFMGETEKYCSLSKLYLIEKVENIYVKSWKFDEIVLWNIWTT